jgi:hypothetical protein
MIALLVPKPRAGGHWGRGALAPALACAIVTASSPARGQSAGDEATAQKLFDEGRALASSGRFAEACPKFAASEQVAPSGGALLNLADCYEKNGQFASAWAVFHEVGERARRAGRADIEKMADERIKQIEPKLSFLTIVVPSGTIIDGLEVRRDGEVVPRGAWGTSLPVDGGAHRVDVKAPGKQPRSLPVTIAPSADHASVTVSPLDDFPPASAPVSGSHAPAAATTDVSPPTGMPFQKVLGLTVAGGGIVALGIGGAFGAQAISKNNAAMPYCPASPQCNDKRGVQLTDEARSAATVSTVLFAAGGVLVATGATLYLTSPARSVRADAPPLPVSVGIAIQPLGAAVGGVW